MDQVTETPRVYTKQEEALIERYRDTNVHWADWYTAVEEQVEEELAEIGFDVTQMYFSGFWSQGDGACFEGTMSDWAKFCEQVPTFVKAFPFLSEYLKDEGATYTSGHSGHYYHEQCTNHDYSSELEYGLDQIDEDEITDPAAQMRYAMYKKALVEEGEIQRNQYSAITTWLKEFFQDKMRDLYERLEQEYDYLTSDDVVWESIEANDLDKQGVLDEEDEDAEEIDG